MNKPDLSRIDGYFKQLEEDLPFIRQHLIINALCAELFARYPEIKEYIDYLEGLE